MWAVSDIGKLRFARPFDPGGPDPANFFLVRLLLLEFQGNLDGFGRTTRKRSLRKIAATPIERDF
jgi:hypothetical protein